MERERPDDPCTCAHRRDVHDKHEGCLCPGCECTGFSKKPAKGMR